MGHEALGHLRGRLCQKASDRRAFPGDEGDHYFQNPGEAFAESFLHLNEVELGVAETPWGYDPMFAPDAKALAALEQDVVAPWTGYSLQHWTGRFARRGQLGTPRCERRSTESSPSSCRGRAARRSV